MFNSSYLIVLFFIGRPLYFLEMIQGQFSSSGSVKVWDVVPISKGIARKSFLKGTQLQQF